MCVFFSCDIDSCYCDTCNDLVEYCVGLAYDVSLSQMIDNKVDSYLKGLINPYYYTLNSIGSINVKSLILESSYDTCRRSGILALCCWRY